MTGRSNKICDLFLTLVLLVSFLLSACTSTSQPNQGILTPTPLPTSTKNIPCSGENWRITITAVDQFILGDGTKVVFVRLGIENNDMLWGSVIGPNKSNENENQKSVILSTQDGTKYGYLDENTSFPLEQIRDSYRAVYEVIGRIETPLLPPGFVTLGKAINGESRYYNFAFQIPESQIPNTITIGGMQVHCIQPHMLGENGIPVYREKRIQLPIKTYNLETDVTAVPDAPSARKYPNLVGTELVTPDWKETIFITEVNRSGNNIIVTFDFTNFSSREVFPSFSGYIMGSSRLFICQNDCKQQLSKDAIKPGQTAQDLAWTFTVPEDETNLIFVYVYGSNVDLNEVRRINLE